MKKSFITSIFIILGGALFCIVLAGCENFMKGSDIRKELEEAVTIANTSPVTYYVTVEEDAGTVIPEQFRAKKNETFEIQLKIKAGWEFIQWEVLDKTTRKVVEDAVQFEDATKPETKVTILGFKENLEIHAKCSIIPMVIEASPKTKEAVFANTPIIFTFNVPVEEDVLDTLELTYKEQDFSSYFEAPVFNEEKTVLTIVPYTKELKQYISSKGMHNIDVDVKIGSGYVVKVGELELPLRENENSAFKVKYKPESEEDPPSLNTAIASQELLDVNTIENLSSSQKLFSFLSFENLTTGENKNAKILNNRTNGKVYIYGKYLEEGSGVKSIILTEKRLRDKSGFEVSDDILDSINYLSNPQYKQNIQLQTTTDGYTEFCIDYDLRSDDGAVLINVNVIDACGNTSTGQDINLTVFKDSYTDLSGIQLMNSSDNLYTIRFDDTVIDEDILEEDTVFNKKVYGECSIPTEQLSVSIDYYDAAGKEKHKTFASEELSLVYEGFIQAIGDFEIPYTTCRYTTILEGFDNENIGGKSITMVVVDDIGNKTERIFTFPKKPVVGRIEKSQPYGYWQAIFYFSTFEQGDILYYKKVNGGWSRGLYEYLNRSGGELDYSYQVQFCRDSLYGPVSEPFDWTMEVDSIDPVALTDSISYSRNSSPHYVNVTVNLPADTWGTDGSNYDQIYFNSYWTSTEYPYPTKVFFTKPQTSVTFVYNVELLYRRGVNLTVYGAKGNAVSTGTNKTFDPPASYEYDNVDPYLNTSVNGSYQNYLKVFNSTEDYYSGNNTRLDDCASNLLLFQTNDEQSGLDYFTIKPEGMDKSYKLDAGEYTFYDSDLLISYVPFWDMDETSISTDPWGFKYSLCNVEIAVYDKKQNSKSVNKNVFFYHIPKVIKVDKNADPSYISFVQESLGIKYFNWHYTVYRLDYDNDSKQYEWNAIKTEKIVHSTGHEKIDPFILKSSLTDDGVYKIVVNAAAIDSYSSQDNASKFGFSDPVYFCKGTCTASSSYILQKTKKAVLVASDGPVYVHTLVTKRPYEECKNWDEEKWEHHRRQIGECKIVVSENTAFQKYDIPIEEIDDGDCYVVIAHFADGSTDMSDVMVKQ